MENIKILWNHLSKRRHRQFLLLLILMILASVAEVISIGSVIPFIAVLTSPDQLYQNTIMVPFIKLFGFTSSDQLVLPLTIIFIVAAILAGIIRLTLLYSVNKLSFAAGADLSIEVFRRTLYQNYSTHIARHSSEIINSIITKTKTVTGGVITPILTLMSSILLFLGIVSTLFTIDALIASIASVGFVVIYLIIIRYTREQLQKNGQCIAEQSTNMIKSLQEGLGGIRDVLIDGSQKFYCKLYRSADLPLRNASCNNAFMKGSPKFAMEALGMTMIAILAYFMVEQEGGVKTTLPILAALALGAQKLLPVIQLSYAAYSNLKASNSAFEDVLHLLNQPLPAYAGQPTPKPIVFDHEIIVNNLSFRYSKNTPWVLHDINLKISKGSRIGFKGVTGSGKSTLLDIVLGLLTPTTGELLVDNKRINTENVRSWQVRIAHVPQDIYLSDASIEENIAFGVAKDKIDKELVRSSAKQAHIATLIETWANGYQTFVGEQGIRLSGGQRQRIGIARAFYKNADVLVFDEATSALDDATERAVMDEIKMLNKNITVLIIAHRLSTLESCDQVIDLSNISSSRS